MSTRYEVQLYRCFNNENGYLFQRVLHIDLQIQDTKEREQEMYAIKL